MNRNIHGVSTETAATSLHDAHGNRADALFTCDECHYQNGHHREGERWALDGEFGETPVYQRAVGASPI